MIGYIYKITDTTNNKSYIGQHHYDKEELDPNYHGSGIIITKIYKNRPETLKEEYLKTCYSQEELDDWEKYFIFSNDTLSPNGYNLTEGGGGVCPCEEVRKKISESNKGKKIPIERRIKISEKTKIAMKNPSTLKKLSESHIGKCKGEKHYLYGKHLPEEVRIKLSKSHTGKKVSEETKNKLSEKNRNNKYSKPILQFTLNGDFVAELPSICEVKRRYGFSQGNVSLCCLGIRKSAYGFIWKYKVE